MAHAITKSFPESNISNNNNISVIVNIILLLLLLYNCITAINNTYAVIVGSIINGGEPSTPSIVVGINRKTV